MKILLPTMRDPGQIGGTSTHIMMLTQGLEELGHDVRALYLGETMPGAVRQAGLIWPAGGLNRVRKGWGMIYAAESRARLIAQTTSAAVERAEQAGQPWSVLNAQEVYSVPYLRKVADKHGLPLVLTLHGYPLYESVSEGYSSKSDMGRNYLMRAELRALRLADAIVTVDTRLYRHALRLVPTRTASTHRLLNFIDTSAFAPIADPGEEARLRKQLRQKWDVPEGVTVLLCPRRLVKKNGVIYPSLALASMSGADRGRFLLLHAGEGGERGEIERIVADKGLEANVRLLGGQDRDSILELFRLADIVLVPSVYSENVEEATSLSALEAMASGRPLIAGNVGGLAEMVREEETGLLVPADAEALARAIIRLAADHDFGERLARAARDYVVENHSHIKAAGKFVEVYRQAAEQVAGSDHEPRAATHERATGRDWESISILGMRLDIVGLEQAAQWVIETALDNSPSPITRVAASFNPELVIRAQADPRAAEALLEADLCYADGVGSVWAAKRQGARLHDTSGGWKDLERVAGVDLARRVLEIAAEKGIPVYFLGAGEGVAEEAARRQASSLPGLNVVGCHNGYFSPSDEGQILQTIRDSGARILFVGMGAPRQEIFLHEHRADLGVPVALGIGGSLDVWAGVVSRAPEWTQRAKIEWLYRLASNPRRLRRQMVLPRYASQVLRWFPGDYSAPQGRSGDADGGPVPRP